MKKINNFIRAKRVMLETINRLDLNLHSMTVLTELASGYFIVTPLLAVLAGADKVYVVGKDSKYGSLEELLGYLSKCINMLGIETDRIQFVTDKNLVAHKVNIVTNLGFVRPIDADFIKLLPYDAAIPLMFESWEFRDFDIDISACRQKDIPVLGTNENDGRLNIFRYVGITVLKLMLEAGFEIFGTKVLLISSGSYLKEINYVLSANNAIVRIYNPFDDFKETDRLKVFLQSCDVVVVAEQAYKGNLLDANDNHINLDWLVESDPLIIHVSGMINETELKNRGVKKYPSFDVNYGYMTVTTEYVGIKPVAALNAAGLKVGEEMVRGLRKYHDSKKACEYAVNNSPAMFLNINNIENEMGYENKINIFES